MFKGNICELRNGSVLHRCDRTSMSQSLQYEIDV